MTTTMPPLPTLNIGDRLIITEHSVYRRTEPLDVVVTKVGRVWVNLTTDPEKWPDRFRMRIATQDDGSQYTPRFRFWTADQMAWRERRAEQQRVINDAGIELTTRSPYRGNDDFTAALALFLTDYRIGHPAP